MNTEGLSIVQLREYPDALGPVVDWIDREWGTFSGRSFSATRAQFAAEFNGDGLPVSVVAISGARPVGVASLRERDSIDWDPGVIPWVCNVYVVGTARRRGVAGRLCLELEALAAAYGYGRIYLATTMAKDSLYHQLDYRGYKTVESTGQKMLLMRRDIPVPADRS